MSNENDFEDYEYEEAPEEELPEPEMQPAWARFVAWATLFLGGVYIINPTAGLIELIPDNFPIIGNLDEAAAMLLIFAALRYLGVRLPEFIERWSQPVPMLPARRDDSEYTKKMR